MLTTCCKRKSPARRWPFHLGNHRRGCDNHRARFSPPLSKLNTPLFASTRMVSSGPNFPSRIAFKYEFSSCCWLPACAAAPHIPDRIPPWRTPPPRRSPPSPSQSPMRDARATLAAFARWTRCSPRPGCGRPGARRKFKAPPAPEVERITNLMLSVRPAYFGA